VKIRKIILGGIIGVTLSAGAVEAALYTNTVTPEPRIPQERGIKEPTADVWTELRKSAKARELEDRIADLEYSVVKKTNLVRELEDRIADLEYRVSELEDNQTDY